MLDFVVPVAKTQERESITPQRGFARVSIGRRILLHCYSNYGEHLLSTLSILSVLFRA
jgi:hypothetical protein